MRVLIITSGCYPSGGAFSLRVHSLAQMASKVADVSILSIFDPRDPRLPGTRFHHKKFPEPFISKLVRTATYYRTGFQKIGIGERPDIIQIESPALFGFARQFPRTPVVFDEHNVWWELEAYNMRLAPTIRRLPFKDLFIKWFLGRAKRYEMAALKRSSRIIACSEADARVFVRECPFLKDRISCIPNCLDVGRYTYSPGDDDVVLFVGALNYYPNIDALNIICRELAPRVKAEFHIMGEGEPRMKLPPNVKLLGHADDARKYLPRAKVCIAPLRYGSGSRLKILEYMATGKAVVSTTKGAEGLSVESGRNIFIEDNMEKFAAIINHLLSNDEVSENIGREARQLVEERYDYRLYSATLGKIYSNLAT